MTLNQLDGSKHFYPIPWDGTCSCMENNCNFYGCNHYPMGNSIVYTLIDTEHVQLFTWTRYFSSRVLFALENFPIVFISPSSPTAYRLIKNFTRKHLDLITIGRLYAHSNMLGLKISFPPLPMATLTLCILCVCDTWCCCCCNNEVGTSRLGSFRRNWNPCSEISGWGKYD